MRSARDAPVDNMGAEKCMDEHATPEVCSHYLFYFQDQSVYSMLSTFSNDFCYIICWAKILTICNMTQACILYRKATTC